MEIQESKAVKVFGMKVLWSSCLIFLLACTPGDDLPYYPYADMTPVWVEDITFNPDTVHSIPNFSLLNQNGEVVNRSKFEGEIYVANFFFTVCPGICPRMTENLKSVAEEISEIHFISHSVTPEMDSVSQLKQFSLEHGLDKFQWDLVTGSREDIYSLARNSYFTEQEVDQNMNGRFLHTEKVLLIDRKGRIRGVYNGTLQAEMDRLIEDVRILL